MSRFQFIFIAILLALSAAPADAFDPAPIEEAARAYATVQPGLETSQSDIESKALDDLFAHLAAARPPETPRPAKPVLRRYWSRASGKALFQLEGKNISPAIQNALRRFASENVVDPRTFFLPPGAAERRRRLLEKADIKTHETQLDESRTLHIELAFPEPIYLRRAFYGTALGLPQRSIKGLILEIDPDRKTLDRLEITLADERRLEVEIRHEQLPRGGRLPREVRITSPSGSIDDHLAITFTDVQGYRVPGEQVRTIHRPGIREKRTFLFTNQNLNITLPEEISRRLK